VGKLLKSESFDDELSVDILPDTPIDSEAISAAQNSTPIYYGVTEEMIYKKEEPIDSVLNKCGLCNDKLVSYYDLTFCGICSPDCPLLK
jgi:hypothetical protein